MSNEETPVKSPQTRSLIEALNATFSRATDTEIAADNEEECTVCDLIERRLGHRSNDCAPTSFETAQDLPVLSSSAREGLAHWSMNDLSPIDSSHREDSGSPLDSREEPPEEASWQSTIGELNATLALAMSHLGENAPAPTPALSQRHEYAARIPGSRNDRGHDESAVSREDKFASDMAFDNSAEDFEPAQYDGRAHERPARRDSRKRFSVRGSLQLAAVAILVLSLGALPFVPSILDGWVLDAPVVEASKERPSIKFAEVNALAPGNHQAREQAPPLANVQEAFGAPKTPSVEITLDPIFRGRAGQTLALPISANLKPGAQAGAFAVLRGFPSGTKLSQGQALGPNLWTTPFNSLAGLKITLPVDAPDVSLITVEVFDVQRGLLAKAACAVVATRAAEANSVAPAAVERKPTAHSHQEFASWPSAGEATGFDDRVALMVSARHRQLPVDRDLSWANIQPRMNLVHLLFAITASSHVENAPPPVPVSAPSPRDNAAAPNVNPGPGNHRSDLIVATNSAAISDATGHWRSYKPEPDRTRLVKLHRPAAKRLLPVADDGDDDDASTPSLAVEPGRDKSKTPSPRAHREEPIAPEKSTKVRDSKHLPPDLVNRKNVPTRGDALGGPVPRKSASAPPTDKVKSATTSGSETKLRLRHELLDGSKGI